VHTRQIHGGPDESGVRRLSPPSNEVPAPLDLRVEVLRTDDLAVFLLGGSAYSTGLQLRVVIRVRPGSLTPEDTRLRSGLVMHGDVLVGFELADGTVLSNARGPWGPDGEIPPDGPLMLSLGAGADLTSVEQDVWISPVPPPGRLLCVVAHPAGGIPETRVELDATPLVGASARAVRLWPWEPDPQWSPAVDDSRLDPGGWFERHSADDSEHHDG
jgi:hypothetical protein